jgi:hypothetical protein
MITAKYKGNLGRLRESPKLVLDVLDRFKAIVGLHTVQFWQLPPQLSVTTFCSGQPESVPDERCAQITHAVALADAMAKSIGSGFDEEEPPNPVEHPSTKVLGLSPDIVEGLCAKMKERIETLAG